MIYFIFKKNKKKGISNKKTICQFLEELFVQIKQGLVIQIFYNFFILFFPTIIFFLFFNTTYGLMTPWPNMIKVWTIPLHPMDRNPCHNKSIVLKSVLMGQFKTKIKLN